MLAAVHYGMVLLSMLALVAMLWSGESPAAGQGLWPVLLVGPIVFAMHAAALYWDPNRKPGLNLPRVPQGVVVLQPGDPARTQSTAELPLTRLTCTVMFIAALLTPGVLLSQSCLHLPTNPAHSPTIVAPGDTLRVRLPSKIESVKGLWRAEGTATLVDARSLELADPGPLPLNTNDDCWSGFLGLPSTIHVRPNEYSVPLILWADITLPNDDKFTDKTIEVKIHLKVEYPKYVKPDKPAADGNECYLNNSQQVDAKVEVHLASHAGVRFHHFLGCIAGLGLVVLAAGSWMLGQLARAPLAMPLPIRAGGHRAGKSW
jgi:hypothetical protein